MSKPRLQSTLDECRDDEYYPDPFQRLRTDIFTQGRSLDDLMENIKEAVSLHFEDQLQSGEEIRVLSISEFEVHPVAKASSS
jgi:hypothetical protein